MVLSTLYGVFGARVSEDYLARLIGWHRQETQDRGLEVLERCLIVHSNWSSDRQESFISGWLFGKTIF